MHRMKRNSIAFALLLSLSFLTGIPSASAGDPYSGDYCTENNKIFWFIHTSDLHVGASGSQDSGNLQWLVTQAKDVIQPSFFVVSGDLTDSTNGNILGFPDGPHQEEWNLYKNILAGKVDSASYYDLPGNHDAYNDRYFAYYLANSIQGQASKSTQISWIKELGLAKYHFLGVNTADNTGASFSLFPPYGDHAGLDTTELSFIQNELNIHNDAALTLIFGHHPLAATGDSSDTYVYYGRDEFVTLMQTHGVSLYGYGHTHSASEGFYTQKSPGIYYFNVASLGKSSSNQYFVTAIDCNGLSSAVQTVNTWPVVLITAPMDKYLGGAFTPFVYPVPTAASNPIRALVFDPNSIISVKYRIDGGTEYPMTQNLGNPHLWEAVWNASSLPPGDHTIQVSASNGSATRGNTITVAVQAQEQPKIGSSGMVVGKYQTSGSKRNTVRTFLETSSFLQGDTVIFRVTLRDSNGSFVANGTAEITLSISGQQQVVILTGPSNSQGVAEAKWPTSAPNKRGTGGTPAGPYTGTLTKISASGYLWDGIPQSANFTLSSR